MSLPSYMQADINDGMDPVLVAAIHCTQCGKYLGQFSDFSDDAAFDEDSVECDPCELEAINGSIEERGQVEQGISQGTEEEEPG